MLYKVLIATILFFGVLFIVVEIVKINSQLNHTDNKVIYRYIPRSFEQEQNNPISISEIFKTMFSQPSPWIGSIRTYDEQKQNDINNYFISQM